MDELRCDVWALHPKSQDMDWLFYSNNPLAPKIAIVGLPRDFKVPKDMCERKRDPQAYLMQYNDYINLLGASDTAKCKAFSTTLKTSTNDWTNRPHRTSAQGDAFRNPQRHQQEHVRHYTLQGIEVKRILVNSGSIVEVLSWEAYKEMSLKRQSLLAASPLYGFVNYPVEVRGTITLAVTLGDVKHTTIECVQFYVVDHPMAYNAIFDEATSDREAEFAKQSHQLK
ncbi:hypothetical protein PVK06_012267 [Gossypium arboreum]|uniref:Uncharacterized protein n=1 Tax=Gossypium arboreum TaxID=29729 RepID=A0ABR0QBA5_GOSAR|nr:hypothetical protein PVK06_012267 [Gossypium arboreum]